MSNLYIHNGNEWCNICSNKAKIQVPSGDWVQIGKGTGVNKYYNGTEWVKLECCYEILVAPETPEVPELVSRIEIGNYQTPFTLPVMNFMEDPAYIPTCQELKNVGCIDGDYGNGWTYGDAADKYRATRDLFLNALVDNTGAEHAGMVLYEPLNYQQWLPGELSDKLIYNKGGLMNYSDIRGCPECTYSVWHNYYYYMLNQVTAIVTDNPGKDLKDGVYNNVEFGHVSGPSPRIGLYFTANISVVGGVVTGIQTVKKGSGYTLDEVITPLLGQIEESCETTSLPEVTIGTQTWTASNLNVTTYRNGDIIPEVTDPVEWESLTTGAWCHYNNDPANEAVYGKLYNWHAVNDPRGLAPAGWHVPTDAEWTVLTDYLGGESVAGGKLKEAGTTHWIAPNTDAINNYDFTALPGGYRANDGGYDGIGVNGGWWSSSENGTDNAWGRGLSYYYGDAYRVNGYKEDGFSVRLVKGSVLPTFRVAEIKMNRIVDILPTVNQPIKILRPDIIPETGVTGEKLTNGPAWDPIMNIWNLYLGDAMEDIQTTRSSKRNAERKALNQLNLAHAPFLSANEYMINHRWRNEVI